MSKRRLACERCRDQKLKCIRRDENNFEPCVRCLQAQAECIVSLRKTPGRPAGRNNPSSHHCSTREPQESRTKSLDSGRAIESGFVAGNVSILPEDLFGMASTSLDGSGSDPATLFSPVSPPMYIQDFADSRLKYPDPATDFPFLWGSSSDSSALSRCSSFHLLDQTYDPGFQLPRLQQQLSKQLFLLRSVSWDITTVMKLDCSPCSCQRQAGDGSREFNPLSSTFEVISEFEQLLSIVRSRLTHQEGGRTPGFRQEMNVSYSLTAMSCYLQLVLIYDCIFSYVLDQASSNPVVRDFILNSTPNISLGGFVVPSPKNVFGRLFVQLMQLKIRPIEFALGLPPDCCVSEEPNCDSVSRRPGLLGGKQGESILAALKGSCLEETDDTKTLGVIEALKDKMTRIELLE
ncbi:hypothetical protein ANOM_002341 [Aspergillus nomiae NRRL 13137]|uniref:Zn(2)-C6 fungal-type domain-containing protein n=1 Tax=Aspergillus nomiae NRRL (strain ATCC 15546 / NRRL 13137 / CBS 260.88 / M93) TaxID=1509407 RepID=A0A0L1JE57_ASPN3|nr:uncharacterized protein ANOM_002341 [Aspergillus nomiae NRRL 13137]KNG89698.1 hypothetical protein ANOM_002341 [Aspergillus nomiae NRRL 13137]